MANIPIFHLNPKQPKRKEKVSGELCKWAWSVWTTYFDAYYHHLSYMDLKLLNKVKADLHSNTNTPKINQTSLKKSSETKIWNIYIQGKRGAEETTCNQNQQIHTIQDFLSFIFKIKNNFFPAICTKKKTGLSFIFMFQAILLRGREISTSRISRQQRNDLCFLRFIFYFLFYLCKYFGCNFFFFFGS